MSLEVNDISYSVDGTSLLEDLSAVYEAGSITAILGPNGAGKSTLLACIAGLKRPASGEVRVGGKQVASLESAELARNRAFLPQEHQLNFPFSVEEVVALGRSPWYGISAGEQDRIAIDAAIADCDLSNIRKQAYTTLSGGEKQRTHIARVIAQSWLDGPLDGMRLILDEPTASLDIRHQHMLMSLLRALGDRGMCVVCVVHDLNIAAQYADRIQLLKAGSLVADGDPGEVMIPGITRDVFGIDVVDMTHPGTGRPILVPADGLKEPG